jgi:hypothetical protein
MIPAPAVTKRALLMDDLGKYPGQVKITMGMARQGINCGFCRPEFADLKFSIRITSHSTKNNVFRNL